MKMPKRERQKSIVDTRAYRELEERALMPDVRPGQLHHQAHSLVLNVSDIIEPQTEAC